jgi:RNA polymerase sigma factor (TIGR02999 family)
MMRSIIVDFARAKAAERRGGDAPHLTLNTELVDGTPAGEQEILHVHEALADIARLDPRLAQVVEMRYFGGMTDAEIGAALGLTDRTVRRDWDKARLLLAAALRG